MNFLSIFSIFSKKGGGGGGGDANVDNITLQKVGDTLSFKVKTSGDKNKVWKVKTDGTWNLANINEWKLVPTFVGEEGNTYTLYCLTEDVTISNVKYPKGFYTWDSENGFVARSSVVDVDNVTIDKDEDGKLEIKLEGVETKHIKPSALAKSTDNVRDYETSVDTKLTTEKFLQKVLQNIATPQNATDAVNKEYVDYLVEVLSGKIMKFKGFVSSTTPPGTIADGTLWYQGSTVPTTFPINVKTYDATNSQWSSTTIEYSPTTLDLWSNLDDKKGYYWFGNSWNLIDENVLVDDVMIMKNQNGELTFKTKTSADKYKTWVLKADGTWGLELKTDWLVVNSFDNITFDERTLYILAQDTTYEQETYKVGFYTWDETNGLVARSSLVEVDNVTIGRDANDKLEIKDEGITFAKFNPNLTKQGLANDYYFKFSDGTNTYYTKTIVDGANIDVYTITITNNKITAITLQETKATLANGVLTYSSVEYAHDVFGDGFYVVGDDEILITISALQDILEKAGKVNDVKFGNKSIVSNKEAVLEKIDNLEDNYYFAFKNGSNYIYIKSKAIGTNKNTYLFTYTDNVLTKITLSDKKSEIKLNDNGVLVATYDSNNYTYDTTKDNYCIIDPTDKTASIQASLSSKDFSRCFEYLFINPNPVKYFTGDEAFVYRTTASAGLTITGDYSGNTPRVLWIQGEMGHFSCTLKGTAVANAANWTYIGRLPVGKRPKYQFSIVGMAYTGNGNEACGGYVTPSGDVVVWTNAKTATNNYQIRVSFSYELED